MTRQIESCIVNHNSSVFAELALRSLIAHHAELISADQLRITVIDNHSTDENLANLRAACAQLGALFELSSWPLADTHVNSHGDVMRRFVADHPSATHYLFADTDTYCLADATVDHMAAELDADPDAWAVQARFSWIEENAGSGESLNLWSGRIQQLRATIDETSTGTFSGQHKSRCHPAFALVSNTPAFRRVAEIVGLSAAVIISADPTVAGFADTFGLATLAMKTHALKHFLSEATVGHYHGVTYNDPNQPVGAKLDDCHARLLELRSAMSHAVEPRPGSRMPRRDQGRRTR